MVETAPWWGGLLLPAVLVSFGFAGSVLDRAIAARAAGVHRFDNPVHSAAGLLVRQRRRTLAADSVLLRSGGVTLVVAGVLASLATPLGHWVVSDFSVGVVWFNAMEVLAWAAVWLVGWGANSAFSLIAGYRFVAQGLAYELPHMFALITTALGAGSLRVGDIVAAQDGLWFVVWMPVAFVVYLLSALAMAFFRVLLTPLPSSTAPRPDDPTMQLGEALMGSKMLVMIVLGLALFATMVTTVVLSTHRGRYDRFGDRLERPRPDDPIRGGLGR